MCLRERPNVSDEVLVGGRGEGRGGERVAAAEVGVTGGGKLQSQETRNSGWM